MPRHGLLGRTGTPWSCAEPRVLAAPQPLNSFLTLTPCRAASSQTSCSLSETWPGRPRLSSDAESLRRDLPAARPRSILSGYRSEAGKARKCEPVRSYRTVRRRQSNNQAIDRSIFQRCPSSRSPDSIPGRAIRGDQAPAAEPGEVVGGEVRLVSADLDRSPPARSTHGTDGWYRQDQRLEGLAGVKVRPGHRNDQWDALAVGQDMQVAAFLPRSTGFVPVRPLFSPGQKPRQRSPRSRGGGLRVRKEPRRIQSEIDCRRCPAPCDMWA